MDASELMRAIPFSELRRGAMTEYLHPLFAVRAVLRAIEKCADMATEDDFAGIFDKLIDKPPAEHLGQIKDVVKTTAAAGLVFMHSAFENAVFDLLRRLLMYNPEGWVKQIEDRCRSLGWNMETALSRMGFPCGVAHYPNRVHPTLMVMVLSSVTFQRFLTDPRSRKRCSIS